MAHAFIAAFIINEILEDEEERKRKNRKRIWVKEGRKRPTNLQRELELTSPNDYQNFLRMDNEAYEELLTKVKPYIERKNTHLRESISPNERLSATLRFLATGRSCSDLKFDTYIAKSTLCEIIAETCRVLIKVLKDFISIPKNEEEWKEIAKDFNELWNFPNCLGAIDGKHINIIKPIESGACYLNYKKAYSIVLMALVNAKHEFIMVDVGTNGRIFDGGIYSNTKFYQMYEEGKLKIPKPTKIADFNKELPYVFVANDAFPLKQNFIKPYSQTGLTEKQEYFNYRVSRARQIVENTFGIISSRFRVLLTTIHRSPERTTEVVLATCYLHNFLTKRSPTSYLRSTDIENITKQRTLLTNLQLEKSRNSSNLAKEIRKNFCEYFDTSGRLPKHPDA